MQSEDKRQYRIFTVGGRDFKLYYENGDSACSSVPDFEAHPEYTEEGRPFTQK